MSELTNVELKTPEEWAEEAGLMIHDFDGFMKAYEALEGKKEVNIIPTEYIMTRTTIIPKAILCTREVFDRALTGCSISIPKDMDYGRASMVAPNYIESLITHSLYGDTLMLQDIEKYGDVPSDSLYTKDEFLIKMLRSIEGYEEAVRDNKKLNNIQEERPLSEVAKSIYVEGKRLITSQIKNGTTVEALEQKLIAKVKKSIEDVIAGKKDISTISQKQIDAICSLQRVSVRAERHKDISVEDLCYKNPLYGQVQSDMEMQTYRIVNGKGEITNVVAGMQGGFYVSMLTDEQTYQKAREKNEKKKTSMRAIVASAVEVCTKEDLDEARMIEDKQMDTKEQTDPEEGEL